MDKPITIDGADPAAAVQKLLDAAKREGELTIHRDLDTEELTVQRSGGPFKKVTVQNSQPGTWRGIFMEFRRRAKMKQEPSGRATFQQGTITNDNPKKGEVMGAALFKIRMNRVVRKELPSRITVTAVN